MAHHTYSDSASKTPLILGLLAILAIIGFFVFASTKSIPVDNTGAPTATSSEPLPDGSTAPALVPDAAAPASGG
ncbi:MAG: hypothetical protein WBA92_03020 [Pseudorhodobacter sp.]